MKVLRNGLPQFSAQITCPDKPEIKIKIEDFWMSLCSVFFKSIGYLKYSIFNRKYSIVYCRIRQPYGELGSFVQTGRHLYLAVVLFDEFSGYHQAKTGTAVPFGAKK